MHVLVPEITESKACTLFLVNKNVPLFSIRSHVTRPLHSVCNAISHGRFFRPIFLSFLSGCPLELRFCSLKDFTLPGRDAMVLGFDSEIRKPSAWLSGEPPPAKRFTLHPGVAPPGVILGKHEVKQPPLVSVRNLGQQSRAKGPMGCPQNLSGPQPHPNILVCHAYRPASNLCLPLDI